MAMMVALTTAVSGMQAEQTALDTIANNIANVNTTGYKAQTTTFSDILSQTISSATAATSTTGGTNPVQTGLGVSVASTSTDTSVGSTSSTSNWTDVALTGEGYYIVQLSDGSYAYTRNGSMSVDDEGNLTIDGYIVCGWEDYDLDADGNIVYNTDSDVEAINIYSDSYAGDKYTLTPTVTTSSSISGNLNSEDDVAANATGLTSIGDTTDLDFDATTEITVYDSQGNDYDVTVSLKKCAVEGDITTWYYELSSDDTTISPSSGYIAFDADGNIVTSATTLSATVQDTAGYTSSDITASTAAASGTYNIVVTGTSGAYTITAYDSSGTAVSNSITSTDGSGTLTLTAGGTLELTAPTTISTGTSSVTVASTTTNAVTASSTSNTAGYATSNITAAADTSGDYVTAGSYVVVVTSAASGTGYDINVYAASDTTYSTSLGSVANSTDGSGTITLSTGGTLTLTAPTSFSTGSTTIAVTSTTSATETVTDAGYAYSNVAIGTGSTSGDYTITVAQNSDGSTWDITLAYPDGTTKTVTGSKDGSATFTTTAGTITLSAPDDIQAGTTTFTVASTSYTFTDSSTITVTTPASAGTSDITVELDFSDLETSDTSDSLSDDTDGYSAGTASSYSISSDGTIYCTYDNGETISIGEIALAVFENAEGLNKIGDSLYTESLSSGDADFVVAGEGGSGTMTSYALELSNVDLASEFSNMMISQRAYQANSKMISTCDDVLQSLINMVG